jgi:hypothetical protein
VGVVLTGSAVGTVAAFSFFTAARLLTSVPMPIRIARIQMKKTGRTIKLKNLARRPLLEVLEDEGA